jgi:hypothetical protein
MKIILPTIGTRNDVQPYIPGENWLMWFIQQSYAYFAMG